MSVARYAALLGAVLMFLAVAIGAFGAHALEERLASTGRDSVFATASQYHFYNALALLFLSAMSPQRMIRFAINMLFLGVLVFSGSLYCLAIFNLSWMGMITPLGGLCLLIAWVGVIYSLVRTQS